jgi:hypothetical protein
MRVLLAVDSTLLLSNGRGRGGESPVAQRQCLSSYISNATSTLLD